MVRFSKIQQFPDFLETFRTISHRFEVFGIFGWIKSALGEVLGLQLIIKPLTDKWQMAENLTDNWQIDEITDTYGGPQLLLE